MNDFENEYYLVFKKFNPQTLYLTALQKSADRRYRYKKLRFGEEPLFFENGYKEQDKARGVTRLYGKAHENISTLVVRDEIYEDIKGFNIRYLQLYPSVIIDDDNNYLEGYWTFNYYDRVDCVDFERSTVEDYDPNGEDHDVEKFIFKPDILAAIPEEERLIIMPANANKDYTIFHKKIVDIFNKHNVDTLRFIKVADWEYGKQF
ncbi:hypothetical protein [Photobacterium kagoshimensis]|uniref:hypothetical protein n=1 Tax=Photobacterium kagoshimensis TaxID=2910242 RepID=UPI003D141411